MKSSKGKNDKESWKVETWTWTKLKKSMRGHCLWGLKNIPKVWLLTTDAYTRGL